MRSTSEIVEMSAWYEQCIEWLLQQSSLDVRSEPRINGKKPDLLVAQPNGPDIVIECLVKMKDAEHQSSDLVERKSHSCGGDIRELHSAAYSRLQEKATKYRSLSAERPYVIALYDDECMAGIHKAFHLAFSAHAPYISYNDAGNVVESGYRDMWSTPDIEEGIFRRFHHVSGLLYSRWERDHNYLPNPFANIPISPDIFPFANVPAAPPKDGKSAWRQREPLFKDTYLLPPNTWYRQAELLALAIRKLINSRTLSARCN